jgi:hypothetical protein
MQLPWAKSGLTLGQIQRAGELISTWDIADQITLDFLLFAIDEFASDHIDRISAEAISENPTYRRYLNFARGSHTPLEIFLAVYLIGGNLTKTGKRGDIDLLVATNLYTVDSEDDPFVQLRDLLLSPVGTGSKPLLRVRGYPTIPDDYDLTDGTFAKSMMRIYSRPIEDAELQTHKARPVDLTYVKSFIQGGSRKRDYLFLSEQEFFEKDVVAKTCEPLARLPLYKISQRV